MGGLDEPEPNVSSLVTRSFLCRSVRDCSYTICCSQLKLVAIGLCCIRADGVFLCWSGDIFHEPASARITSRNYYATGPSERCSTFATVTRASARGAWLVTSQLSSTATPISAAITVALRLSFRFTPFRRLTNSFNRAKHRSGQARCRDSRKPGFWNQPRSSATSPTVSVLTRSRVRPAALRSRREA